MVWWSENLSSGFSVTAKEALILIKASLSSFSWGLSFLVWKMIGLDLPVWKVSFNIDILRCWDLLWHQTYSHHSVRCWYCLFSFFKLGDLRDQLWQEQMSFHVTFLNEKASFCPLLEPLLQCMLAVTSPDVALTLHLAYNSSVHFAHICINI